MTLVGVVGGKRCRVEDESIVTRHVQDVAENGDVPALATILYRVGRNALVNAIDTSFRLVVKKDYLRFFFGSSGDTPGLLCWVDNRRTVFEALAL